MEWIVDKMPEKEGVYIVSVEYENQGKSFCGVMSSQYNNNQIYWIGICPGDEEKIPKRQWQCECFGMKVKAWMPYPNPYKSEGA